MRKKVNEHGLSEANEMLFMNFAGITSETTLEEIKKSYESKT